MSDKKDVKPWDMLNKNIERALPDIAKARLDICKSCPEYIRFTHQCKKCGCVMNAKAKLKDATCPLDKWASIEVPFDREITEEDLLRIRNGKKKNGKRSK